MDKDVSRGQEDITNGPLDQDQTGVADPLEQQLRQELENKRFFLEQAERALQNLDIEALEAEGNVNAEAWNKLLETQLFIPERSDPLGIAVAIDGETKAVNSGAGAVLSRQIEELEEMVQDQRKLCDDMQALNSILKKRVNASFVQEEATETPCSSEEVEQIKDSFLSEFLVPDLCRDASDWPATNTAMEDVLRRLVKLDPQLRLTDFAPHCMGLYRMLSKANVIQEIFTDGHDNPYIRLYNLLE
ncbi:ABL073Wp [Eremothecium gossypii ATCC 10895]|uniref:ABL073Wp n=1 Tax=Eremothecium gossypii (strain ATCC 10895 / CBS 109.51 / FGSC 9923 / NRRL Y-1056) TaxID=284811 RepID=Q75DU6_EREGS|nr:ABL073Wp [Eremothecium gossypii ATCC 10895]AAS50698.2 ABL073Wp [Eremothecium gossypii ATCC 10895]AEY94986.1 FABL073Wp [Eremothecium gossypii FDAG1]